ncbi:MAG: FAD-dependent oxidoreductase [Saprospiraceae bacterium]|nr:FAD-dependent oxidoreductase [Lewinella sp.]
MQKLTLFGAGWCPNSLKAKVFLQENNIPFEYVNVDVSKDATEQIADFLTGDPVVPTLLWEGKTYPNPSETLMAELLGINPGYHIRMYGADWCPDCRRAKAFLRENELNFQYIDVDQVEGATETVTQLNNGKRIIPTILINEEAFSNPNNTTLRQALNLPERENLPVFDVAVVGGGAAGLTTAIYAQRDRFSAIVLEKKNIGGNAFLTETIENYPGFQSISGPDLMERMADQATTYGARLEIGSEVRSFHQEAHFFTLDTTSGEVRARSIVLAVGSTYRLLGIPGEKELIGNGVHFCATCDGAFYRDKEVLVIGGGNSALEESIFLARFCKKVTIIHRSASFSASETYIEKLPVIDNIETRLNVTPVSFKAGEDGAFESLTVKDNESGQEEQLSADGVFIFIGLKPNTGFLKKSGVELDEKGFIITDGGFTETNIHGVFAAGDCRKGAYAQVAAATGEGVMASYAVRRFLK